MTAGSVTVAFLDDGTWSQCFGQSLLDLYLADSVTARRIVPRGRQLRNYCGTGGLVAGRNEIARQFLDATDTEWLFLVDADMGFAPDTVDRLVDAAETTGAGAAGALCFALRRTGTSALHAPKYTVVPTCYTFEDRGHEVGFRAIGAYPRDTVFQVGATGAACLLVHRAALEQVRATYGDAWFDPITHPTGPTTFSEDLSFCVRLAACDIPLVVDTAVKTCHDKGGVFLDEDEFDRHQALADAARITRPVEVPA